MSNPSATARNARWLHGVRGESGLAPSRAQTQKFINFHATGSVPATLFITH